MVKVSLIILLVLVLLQQMGAFRTTSSQMKQRRIRASSLFAKKNGKKATAGFTKKMADGSLVLGEHEGKPALIAVRNRFVRRFRFGSKEDFTNWAHALGLAIKGSVKRTKTGSVIQFMRAPTKPRHLSADL